jgi:hypothetical protein
MSALLALLFLQPRTCHCACSQSCVHHLHQLLLTADLSLQRTCSAAQRYDSCHFVSFHLTHITANLSFQRTCSAAHSRRNTNTVLCQSYVYKHVHA